MSKSVKVLQGYLLSMGAKLPKYGADGGKGSETYEAIDSLSVPSYVKLALKEVGVKEITGSQHSPRVLEYQKETSGKHSDDETPWCGAFVSWVFRKSGIDHKIKIPERAKEWINFGIATDIPSIGTVAIKSRDGGGHVCIVVGKSSDGKLLCVGGNQNDEVNIARYSESVFSDFRNYGDTVVTLASVNVNTSSDVKES